MEKRPAFPRETIGTGTIESLRVIPAKAGIQSGDRTAQPAYWILFRRNEKGLRRLDSRLRGNDVITLYRGNER